MYHTVSDLKSLLLTRVLNLKNLSDPTLVFVCNGMVDKGLSTTQPRNIDFTRYHSVKIMSPMGNRKRKEQSNIDNVSMNLSPETAVSRRHILSNSAKMLKQTKYFVNNLWIRIN